MSTCPIRTQPGQILGYRYDGRPIFPIAGGAPDGDGGSSSEGEQSGQADGEQQAGQQGGQESQQSTGSNGAAGEWDGKVESLPPAVQKLIQDVRDEAGKARTNAKAQAAQEAQDELLRKLGLTKDGEKKVDPDQLAKQLADREAEMATMRRERAAEKAARTHRGDVDALLDSRKFARDLEALDPAATDFDKKVDALVKKAIDDNPKLRTGQASGASSVDHSGGSGERRTGKPLSLSDAVGSSYGTR